MARWSREHGYHFLVLTDHNFLTSVDGLNALHGADERLLIVKGEEVTSSFEGKPLHVNGLDTRAIVEALERGDFYASTGVELTAAETTATRIHVAVKAAASSKYRIQFIGREGRVRREALEPAATCTVRGDEGYVRARVLESNGRIAWVQPVMVPAAAEAEAPAWGLVAFACLLFGTLVVWRVTGSRRLSTTRDGRERELREAAFGSS